MSEQKDEVQQDDQLALQIAAAKLKMAALKARDNLLDFIRFMKPDNEEQDNPDKSTYEVTPVSRLVTETMEKVFKGELLRACVSIPPQFGKSEIISRNAPAWMAGKKPWLNIMLGTYNQEFAEDFGGEVRNITSLQRYKQVFPEFSLRKGERAKDTLVTTKGGRLNFLGRGGAATGKPADILIIDDPIKDDAEAQSPTIRRQLWQWFNKSLFTRTHKLGAIVIVHTRWHEDDLIGRLVDPSHPEHDAEVAEKWTYINVPAVITDQALADALGLELITPDEYVRREKEELLEKGVDPLKAEREATLTKKNLIQQFGDRPMVSLWEERKSLKFLAEACRLDRRTFWALYQGQPAPEDGDYFKKDMIVGYAPHELPKNLRKYGASDHALTTDEENDATCLGCFGVDENDDIWILPDLFWERVETDETLDAMLDKMKYHKPLVWWAEDEHINKSLGPFRMKRMQEEKVYCTVEGISPGKRDLKARARSIQGRMQMRKVHFPTFASWWPEAQNELMKFPNGTHDDFVSFLAIIGLGLGKEVAAAPAREKPKGPATGTLGWIKANSDYIRKRDRHLKLVGGM
jgi:predicted phage terminase large subunit-like protein